MNLSSLKRASLRKCCNKRCRSSQLTEAFTSPEVNYLTRSSLTPFNIHWNFLIDSDRFACGCDMAWFIRDNRHLLPAVVEGKCADDSPFPSVIFENLNPNYFAECP